MATPYYDLPWGLRRGVINEQNALLQQRRRLMEQDELRRRRIAAEKERISLEQWQPEPEEQEVKIKTKADGTSTIVSTEKYPGVSQDEIAREQLIQGAYGLTLSLIHNLS